MKKGKSKLNHVMQAKQLRPHTCHWPGCKLQIKPAFWGCSPHWYRLPANIRAKIWASYVPGQEQRMDPSVQYISVAKQAQEFAEKWNREHPDEQA